MTSKEIRSESLSANRWIILVGLLTVLLLIFLLAFGEGSYKGWRLRQDPAQTGLFTGLFDLVYGPVKYSLLGQIFGFVLSLAAVAITLLVSQTLFSHYQWKRKSAERVALCGPLVWVFVAFNWISKMPVGFVAAMILVIFVALNRSKRWLPVLIDPAQGSSRSVLLAYLSLMILSAFFWWPGYQLFCALGLSGLAVGDNVAAIVGKRRGKRRFSFSKSRKTLEGTAAMFAATLAFNVLIAGLMIHIPGIQKELFRFLIILLAASLSTAAEALSPKGIDNILIGPATAFPLYFYIH